MLYTIIPIGDVLRDIEKEKIKPYDELTINGVSCYVEKITNFEYKIIRVHSSNPSDYLNNSLQPGSIINLKNNL